MTKDNTLHLPVPYAPRTEPVFRVGDIVQFGEGWEYTGRVVRVLRLKDGLKYVVKYFYGREPQFKDLSDVQLKLRLREVKE